MSETTMTPVERLRAAEVLVRDAVETTHTVWAAIPRGEQMAAHILPRMPRIATLGILADETVALAMAEVLRIEAARVENGADSIVFDGSPMFPARPEMVILADTILGSAESTDAQIMDAFGEMG